MNWEQTLYVSMLTELTYLVISLLFYIVTKTVGNDKINMKQFFIMTQIGVVIIVITMSIMTIINPYLQSLFNL